MVYVWIVFIWVIATIVYYTWKWRKEKKERMIISKAGRRNYNQSLSMSIGRRIKFKRGYRW